MSNQEEEQARVTRLKELYFHVFSSVNGREVLRDIVKKGNLLSPVGSHVAEYSALHEGRRWLALSILNLAIPDVIDRICALDPHYSSNQMPVPPQEVQAQETQQPVPAPPSNQVEPGLLSIGGPHFPTTSKTTRRSKTSKPPEIG